MMSDLVNPKVVKDFDSPFVYGENLYPEFE